MDKTTVKREIEKNKDEREKTLRCFVVVLFFLLILFTMKNIKMFNSLNEQNK